MNDYLSKPVRAEEIRGAIERAAAQRGQGRHKHAGNRRAS
jgi:FixJ family two-component response regulator